MVAFFSTFREWQERRKVIRDIQKQQADDSIRMVFVVKDQMTNALAAMSHNDNRRATEILDRMLELHPREIQASLPALEVFLGLRRFDEAQTLMRRGSKDHPGDPHFPTGLARIAKERGDVDEVLKLCANLRKKFPSVVEGYALAAEALISKQRFSEAENLASRAMRRFPRDLRPFLYFASVAYEQGNWEAAIERYGIVIDKFSFLWGYIGLARTLQKMGRADEADALLLEALTRFPVDSGIRMELAGMAQTRNDIPTAIQRWLEAVKRFPGEAKLCIYAADMLEKLGATDEAEQALRDAVDRFPTQHLPLHYFAALLARRQKLVEAEEAWAFYRRTFPDRETGYTGGAEVLEAQGRSEEAASLREEGRLRLHS
jgi:predicted Zn-dependent protease